MYTNKTTCPICNHEQEYCIRNKKSESENLSEIGESTILSIVKDNIFKVECRIRCDKCRNRYKITKDIEFDLK